MSSTVAVYKRIPLEIESRMPDATEPVPLDMLCARSPPRQLLALPHPLVTQGRKQRERTHDPLAHPEPDRRPERRAEREDERADPGQPGVRGAHVEHGEARAEAEAFEHFCGRGAGGV